MTAELRPLPIYGPILEGDMDALRAAKASLGLSYLITPVAGLYHSPGRILALREWPPFLCDYAPCADPQNAAGLRAALAWVLSPSLYDPRAITILDTLQAVFGPELKEIHDGPSFE